MRKETHLGLMLELKWVVHMASVSDMQMGSHLGLSINLIWVLLMVPLMANLWVYCLVIHLYKMLGLC